jgi:hypothetical protein
VSGFDIFVRMPRTKQNAISSAGRIVILASLCFFGDSCRQIPKTVHAEPSRAVQAGSGKDQYGPPRVLGRIQSSSVNESSGLMASRSEPGVYWTHNDSGDGPFIYAIGSHGESVGVCRVAAAEAVDWEDISIGPGPEIGKTYLYIGDIGDNSSSRREIVVYRVLEPKPDPRSSKTKPQLTAPAEAIRLRYPDGKHDAEALLVHPATGNIYIITKVAFKRPHVYKAKAPLTSETPITMECVGELNVPGMFGGVITGGSVSPDGRRVALCDYFQGYEIVLPSNSNDFEDIWKQRLVSFDFGKRKQGESIAYRLDGRALLGTSEGKGAALVQVER